MRERERERERVVLFVCVGGLVWLGNDQNFVRDFHCIFFKVVSKKKMISSKQDDAGKRVGHW